ncbi:septal ring lytic transglycosylase RlpA family protein [Geobacter sulfurreducens]|jgi:rare lipoprotein A|uniref:Probable endolytic peptidoglycan transglycosylase RlpA n=1 Tax=Geobacter sulfurreducens (strain ATCC 51573 / DSM 12127 / PCA) TaxID=243231 RepID=Q74FZ7_GEOSL|nr:septal ring lytic transglycosylase RlpA family protein [Geobacter sulfurreducens]AAR33787.1 rare lipoprotein A-like double-psi beta-barrel domain lipoprotein, putative [Geobacter sulfurreducens PCA]ADI83291.1 rare lipoprotein A-like double-psi beta-barrel domain protein [Geobacter sulfurreducens KN400]AJY70175.1 lipoprotein [Geobacter sulfurreducens]QVW35713.1 septal ring lytic transglycosylase RlpA family protein [Geobacter sulfurreducens]UAC04533.1 septal ring lytic transglycosylase RlpA 
MVSALRKGRLAILIILCQAFFQIQTLSLQAEEIAAKETSDKEAAIAAAADEGVTGTASYYAKRYHGRRTTSGKRYDPKKLTAAHPTLPLGTKVKVVNLTNDREVTVTITDRCRKRVNHFIDLSREAARRLGFLGKGVTQVRIITLDETAS